MKTINTSRTLLQRIKNTDDHEAWRTFYERYSPLIIGFARQRGCSESMAYDVLQETMCRLIRFMPKFEYDPGREKKRRFRSYLFTVVISRISTIYRARSRSLPATVTPDMIVDIPDPKQTVPGKEIDDLWRKYQMFIAIEQVKKRIDRSTWQSFEMYVLDKIDAATVAEKLQISKNLVYQHKNNVTSLLKNEVNKLKAEMGE